MVGIILRSCVALGLGLFITWLLYRRTANRVLRLAGAVPVSREQEKDLYRLVENLCIGSGMPQPALYLVETPAANALTTGSESRQGIARGHPWASQAAGAPGTGRDYRP